MKAARSVKALIGRVKAGVKALIGSGLPLFGPWAVAFLLSAGACYRTLRRLSGQGLSLLEERVFQDAPWSTSYCVGAPHRN